MSGDTLRDLLMIGGAVSSIYRMALIMGKFDAARGAFEMNSLPTDSD